MKNVILYCRVSTDEQAEGCSLEVQERFLRAYCSNRGYNIIGEPYKDDYSAKHYDLRRPGFKKLYDYCRKHKREVDLVLFLRWDRYARNVEFAFAYKRKLYDELGVEINATELPIDFKAPEWSMLLSMYCGAAHTEDEKIARRTKDGIHGTLLKGKWANRAPRGYKNVRQAKHDCWIEIDEPKAELIRKMFNEIAKGIEAPACIKKRIWPSLPYTCFFSMIRNRFYVGDVFVPAYGDDPDHYVKGQHEPIIDRETFDKVQDILSGKRKKTPKLSKPVNPALYLRKFVVCPICGHALTGAASRGNGGYYNYYFCNHDHKHLSVSAEDANTKFISYVSTLKPNSTVLKLYNEVLMDVRGDCIKDSLKQAERLEKDLRAVEARIKRVNDLYFDGEISKDEKQNNLSRYETEASRLKAQIESLKLNEDLHIKDKLTYSINLIGNLGTFFQSAPCEVKIKLLGSMFPEKIEFDGKKYRTKSFNQMLEIIYVETKQLQGYKKSESSKNEGDSGSVPRAGIEPARYCYHRILSPARLPIPPSGQRMWGCKFTVKTPNCQIFCKFAR